MLAKATGRFLVTAQVEISYGGYAVGENTVYVQPVLDLPKPTGHKSLRVGCTRKSGRLSSVVLVGCS